MKKLKLLFRIVFGRTTFVILFLLIQMGILFTCFRWLSGYLYYVFGGFTLLGAVVVISILNARQDSSFKLAWIVPVLVIPVFGSLFYLFVQIQLGTKLINKRLNLLSKEIDPLLQQDELVMQRLLKEDVQTVNLGRYMNSFGRYPVYDHTYAKYFPQGEDKFAQMKKELMGAKDFIFMEYFIIEPGVMWNSILDILELKAREGVDVRVMYDGMCSIILLPYSYPKVLRSKGIKCKMFSPIKPALSTHQNNRDHRKILVVDGHTAFTGGVNLADEYINQRKRFGHWKDTAVMLKGDAVKSFTMMFLQMWNVTERKSEDYRQFLGKRNEEEWAGLPMDGYVMPYGDSPLDFENVGEQVYMDILYQAKKYVHIMTPYLILDDEMVNALSYAAKRGVETIIIMPHIPDKQSAYMLARSYYPELLSAGVKIYEYTPGFIHAKVFTSDDEKAVIGTINLDFRSLYLHFECAAYLYRNAAVMDAERDFQETLLKCQLITGEDCLEYPIYKKAAGRMLRLFAPLM